MCMYICMFLCVLIELEPAIISVYLAISEDNVSIWTVVPDVYAVSYTHLDVYKRQMVYWLVSEPAHLWGESFNKTDVL